MVTDAKISSHPNQGIPDIDGDVSISVHHPRKPICDPLWMHALTHMHSPLGLFLNGMKPMQAIRMELVRPRILTFGVNRLGQ